MSNKIAWGVGGGLTVAAGGLVGGWWRAQKHVAELKAAVKGQKPDGTAHPDAQAGIAFEARVTGYWPFTARADEQKMEGGVNDRKGHPLHTLEDFQAGKAPYVAVSGDPEIFPYGQRLTLAEWPGVIFRVVDTGSHFMGLHKLYRVIGREPLDVCVHGTDTHVVAFTDATIIPGDHMDKAGKEVAVDKLGHPSASVGGGDGLDLLGVD